MAEQDKADNEVLPLEDEDFFWSVLPFFLSLGMTADEFWHGSPYLTQAFLIAETYKFEKENSMCHRQGSYNYEAYSAVMASFGWSLGGGKGAKPEPYENYPRAITEREKKAEKRRNIEKTLRWVEQGQQ